MDIMEAINPGFKRKLIIEQHDTPTLPSWASPEDFMSQAEYEQEVPCSASAPEDVNEVEYDLHPNAEKIPDVPEWLKQKDIATAAKKKQDVEHGGRLHRRMIDQIKMGDDPDAGYDQEELKRILMEVPSDEQLLGQNSKMEKSNFYNITLPAYRGIFYDETKDEFFIISTCDKAKDCLKVCFAQGAHYIKNDPVVRLNAQKLNYLLNHALTWQSRLINIINNLNDGVSSTIVRWHDSGDFFSEQYMKLAFEVAVKTEFAEHYAYTKEVGMAKRIQRPSNFEFKFSYGGEEDSLIDPNVDGHAHIVPKKLFGDLQPDEDKVNQKGVHYVGKGWNFAPEVINIIKDRLAEAYHIDRNRIITVSELKRIPYNRNGAVRKWYVIGKSGDSDISALRRDVLGIYLLQHK